MLRERVTVMFSLIFVVGVAGCGSASESGGWIEPVDTTQHDNWVFFDPYMMSPSLAFDLSGHSITSGQPWGGVSTGTPDQSWGVLVKAGRHGSSGPADWFRSNASAAACTMDCSTDWPSKLNFAITGTLTINGTGYAVTIGQGFTGSSNNWWIGGPGFTIHPGVYENVVTPDGAYVFKPPPASENSDHFWICDSYDNCPP